MSLDIVNRLRCKYAKGPMQSNGEPEFGYSDYSGIYTVEIPTALMLEAADYIEAATAIQAERVRELEEALAELQRKYDMVMEPTCFSTDGDYWFDCPNDIEFVDGRKVGEEFELLGGFSAHLIRFRVTKAPDDESDDYEVEQALSATAREG